jgi:hypothetical protein
MGKVVIALSLVSRLNASTMEEVFASRFFFEILISFGFPVEPDVVSRRANDEGKFKLNIELSRL